MWEKGNKKSKEGRGQGNTKWDDTKEILEVEKDIWQEEIRTNTSAKGLGPCHRIKRRICAKKGEDVFSIKRRKRESTSIHGRLVLASKVRWPELSQLSLCSEFDKENLMEFLLISLPTYTLYYCGYALTLPWSSCYFSHVTQCDCDSWHDYLSHHCDIVTKSCDSFPHSTL